MCDHCRCVEAHEEEIHRSEVASQPLNDLLCENCEAFDQISEEVLPGKFMVMDDICTLIPSNDNCDIDRDGPMELARNCPLR